MSILIGAPHPHLHSLCPKSGNEIRALLQKNHYINDNIFPPLLRAHAEYFIFCAEGAQMAGMLK